MALLSSTIGQVGLRAFLNSTGSNIVVRTTCCLVGFGFPIYSTFKAIENSDQQEQEKWLIYWAVYGCFNIVEVFCDKLLSWFPLYYHAKLAFLVWLQLPSTNGSRQFYMRFLQPFLLKHQTRFDPIFNGIFNEINNFLSTHQHEIQFLKVALQKMVMAVYQVMDNFMRSQPWGGGATDNSTRDQVEGMELDAD